MYLTEIKFYICKNELNSFCSSQSIKYLQLVQSVLLNVVFMMYYF